DDFKRARRGGIEDLTQVSGRDKNYLGERIVQPLEFAVIDGLHLAPKQTEFLLLIIVRKDLAEPLKGDDFRRQIIPPQHRLKSRRGPRHKPKPQIPGESGTRIAQFMLAVKFAHGFHGWALLVTQTFAHL